MLARQYRFRGHASLNLAYKKGQVFRGQFISLRVWQNDRRKEFRLAVVVSKKVHKSAVVRNRIRRRIYEVVRSVSSEIGRPYDLVITCFSPQIAWTTSEDITRQITGLLGRAAVISSKQHKDHGIVNEKDG